mmetsp:Transcript_48149/g.90128  ORF Transcript_48149/g.90128 Transcript_48149/m.90128 type:complete len:103 (-) Transcript_48149:539-847(-)
MKPTLHINFNCLFSRVLLDAGYFNRLCAEYRGSHQYLVKWSTGSTRQGERALGASWSVTLNQTPWNRFGKLVKSGVVEFLWSACLLYMAIASPCIVSLRWWY